MVQNLVKSLLFLSFLGVIVSFVEGQSKYESKLFLEEELENEKTQLPINLPNAKPLMETTDDKLQKNLDKIIANHPKWASLIKSKRMSVGLVDMYDLENVKYASVNGNNMMYAASLPKIAVLLSAMDALEKNELKDSKELRADLRIMISKSNNAATTRVIDLLGFEKISAVLQDPAYHFYEKDNGGGLWVGKRYASSGKRVGDPIKGISHGASADQVCRFYYQLVLGNLVTRERSKQMLDYMESPEIHHKFVNTLERIAPGARLFRKSGSWSTYHADSILVWEDGKRRYILVALVNDDGGEKIMRDLVKPIEKILKISDRTGG